MCKEVSVPCSSLTSPVARAEVKFISAADLQTIDALWSAASGGKFGYRWVPVSDPA